MESFGDLSLIFFGDVIMMMSLK